MSRSFRQFVDARRLLPPTLGLLVVGSLLPARWLAWEGAVGGLTQTLVAPITNTAGALSLAVRPASPREDSTERVRLLEEEAGRALFMLTQEQQENERLRKMVKDLQQGAELAPDLSLRLLAASVIGRDADVSRHVLHVRAGSVQGVLAGSVAVVDGAQLLGRVQSVGPRVAMVRLITDRASGRIGGLVMVEGVAAPGGIECDLEPAAGGVLRGRLSAPEPRAGEQPPEVVVGQVVRLSDTTWPRNAQMLELGVVESIDPNPEQPIRKIVTVRPRLDLARASEVMLRIAGESEGDSGDGGAGGGGS